MPTDEALKLQRSLPDGAPCIVARGRRKMAHRKNAIGVAVTLVTQLCAAIPHAQTYNCAEYPIVISILDKYGESLRERDAALGEDVTKRCTLGREEVLGYAKGIRKLTEFLNCPEIDEKKKDAILEALRWAPAIEEEIAQVCKQAGM